MTTRDASPTPTTRSARMMLFSDMNAASWLSFVNEARIWAGAVAATAAVVTGIASYAQIRLQSSVSAAKDDALKRFQAEAAERTARAQADAAAATERTATLTREAEALRLEVERERLARLKIEEALAPRRVRPEQIAALSKALNGMRLRIVVNYIVDKETADYAMQVHEALLRAGCEIINVTSITFGGAPIPTGIIVQQSGLYLASAMREAGFAVTTAAQVPGTIISQDRAPAIQVMVGMKP